MDIREFLDELYQLWAKTTGAENMYWMPEDNELHGLDIWAVNEEQVKSPVAAFVSDADSAFITAIHGALPDLVRRTHEALDEADRLDEQRDEQENEKANLMIKVLALEAVVESRDIEISALKVRMDGHVETKKNLREHISDLQDQVGQLNWELSKERGE